MYDSASLLLSSGDVILFNDMISFVHDMTTLSIYNNPSLHISFS